MMNNSKKNIIERLRKAIEQKTEIPYRDIEGNSSIFSNKNGDLQTIFANEFKALGGKFFFCNNHDELISVFNLLYPSGSDNTFFCADAKLVHLLKNAGFPFSLQSGKNMPEGSASICSCMKLIARTGSILFSSVQAEGRSYAIAPDTQIVIASKSQLVYNLAEAMEEHIQKFNPTPSMISLTSGASRTADIEKTLVMGAHGPKELILILMDY